MARILVTEKIADGGLQQLRDAGHDVDIRLGLSPDELLDVVPGAAALIIRSATQVTAARCWRPAPTWSSSAGPASASTTSTSRWRPPAA